MFMTVSVDRVVVTGVVGVGYVNRRVDDRHVMLTICMKLFQELLPFAVRESVLVVGEIPVSS